MLTCLIFGLAPAIRATGTAPGAAMRAGSRGSTDTRERFGMRRALVVAQVALSLVLVVGALLFVRSLRNLMTLDAGFRQDGILVVNLDLRRAGVPEQRRLALYQDIADRLASLPGVESAAQAFIVPVSGSGWNENIVIDGKKYKENVNFNRVSPGYFRTMGTPLLAGRDFDGRDRLGAEQSAIVTELFARTFFHGQDPIGNDVSDRRATRPAAAAQPHRRRGEGHEVHRPARGVHAVGLLSRGAGRQAVPVRAGRDAIVGASRA